MNYLQYTIRMKVTQGAAAQVLLVVTAAVFSPFAANHSQVFGYFAGIIVTSSSARLGLAFIPFLERHPRLEKILNYFLPLTNGLAWGILAGLSICSHLSFGNDLIIPMITVGNAAASSTSLFYDLRLNRLYIVSMFAPQFLGFLCTMEASVAYLGYFLALAMFVLYMLREAGFAHRMFWTNIRLRDEALKKQKEIETSRAVALNSARMAAVGEIAGGLAHELNNPLTIVRGTTALLDDQWIKKTLTDESFHQSVDRIHTTVDRMTKIIRSLLSFAQQTQQDEIVARPLGSIIEEVLDLCQDRLKRQGIDLRLKLNGTEALRLRDRGTQISQVLVNLLNNASDAVSGRPDSWISIQAELKGTFLWLIVEDSGDGIPAAHRDLIFQPFFTTKSEHEGTGLGLSISRNLIENLGGELVYEDGRDHTRFVIKIPTIN